MNAGDLPFDSSVFPGHLSLILRDLVAVGPALGELGSGRHIGGDPDIAADNRAVSDPDAPEDIGSCVDGHIIAENGMTRDALDQGAVVILAERQRTKGHALIETAVVADDAGLADHHACAVVYEEVLADGGARMDIDACARMGHLVDDARDKWHVALVEHMSDAVVNNSVHGGIAENSLARARGRGIPVIGRLGVAHQLAAYLGQLIHELQGAFLAALLAVRAEVVALAGKTEAALNLLGQLPVNTVEVGGHVVAYGFAPDTGGAIEAEEKSHPQALHDFLEAFQRRHGFAVGRIMPDRVQRFRLAEFLAHLSEAAHSDKVI